MMFVRMCAVLLVLASIFGCDAPVADGAGNGCPACDGGTPADTQHGNSDTGSGTADTGTTGPNGQWTPCGDGVAFYPQPGTVECRAWDSFGSTTQTYTGSQLGGGWVTAYGACMVTCDIPPVKCSDPLEHVTEWPVCLLPSGEYGCAVNGKCASAPQSDAGVPPSDGPVKLANGAACTAAAQCQSGYCVDGVCCNASCDGLCMACTAAKKGNGADGTCGSIAASTDPDNECAGTGTCGGTCNGNYMCQFPGSAVVCSIGGSDGTCNGAGTCVPDTGLSDGAACTASAQCQSGYCVDGVCCHTACDGLCRACNLAGSVGTCAYIPNGQDPANECAGALACNGSGGCTTSTSCTADSQCNDNDLCTVDACVSGLCSNTPKVCGSGLVCDPTNGNCVLPSQVNCFGMTVIDPGPDAHNCVWWAKGSGNAISSFSPQDNVAVTAPALACSVTCYKTDGSDTAPQMCSGKWKDGHQQDWSAPGGVLPVSGMGCTWDGKLR